jgi:hypothetical protein
MNLIINYFIFYKMLFFYEDQLFRFLLLLLRISCLSFRLGFFRLFGFRGLGGYFGVRILCAGTLWMRFIRLSFRANLENPSRRGLNFWDWFRNIYCYSNPLYIYSDIIEILLIYKIIVRYLWSINNLMALLLLPLKNN